MFRASSVLTRGVFAATLVAMAACDTQDQFSPDTQSAPDLARRRVVRAIVLTPASVSLASGAIQQFTATARMNDGSTTSADVTYQAAGGSITTAGKYTAGQYAGAHRVIAKQATGTLADTSVVTITATAPAPSTGKTFYTANAESGNLSAWTLPWGVVQYQGTVTASQARPRFGSWGYKYEVTNHVNATVGHDVRTMTAAPQTSMGSPNGRYLSGYYSFWAYVDAGYTAPGWNLLLGWMTGVYGSPSPISNIGLENRNGVTQLMFQLKNASTGHYTAPSISGYNMLSNGWYYMSSSSPAGIKPFPRNQWVHVAIYYKMAPTNGQVTIWQNGTKIMDLTAPSMNTFGGSTYTPLSNTAGDMMLQFGIYGGPKSDGVQRLYVDDFKVTDYRPLP